MFFNPKSTVILLLTIFVASCHNSSEESDPEQVRKQLAAEGISDDGAIKVTEFLFKDRPDGVSAEDLKTEFREFVASLSKEDQKAIKEIITRELNQYFLESGDDSNALFLVG